MPGFRERIQDDPGNLLDSEEPHPTVEIVKQPHIWESFLAPDNFTWLDGAHWNNCISRKISRNLILLANFVFET
jgi:hypothetical protein